MKKDYSEKEFAMIKTLSPHWASIIEKGDDESVVPPAVLRILGEECFIFNYRGKAVESLRKCLKAINYDNIYRHTPEYEKLIEL